jgi:hypothetical protein
MRDPEDEALLRYDELAIPAMWFGHVVALVVFVLAQLLPTVRNGAWQPYSALEMLGDINLATDFYPEMVVGTLAFLNGPLTILIFTFLIINLIFPALAWLSVGLGSKRKQNENNASPTKEGWSKGTGWLKKRK